MKKIPYISSSILEKLQSSIEVNLDRYSSSGFCDLQNDARWQPTLDIEYDEGLLSQLKHDPNKSKSEDDRCNSEIVGVVFGKLTPQLACREEIWVRLSHIECLDYSRERWFKGEANEQLSTSVNRHMFAPGRPGRREYHAISRLWWTYHLAKCVRPDDPKSALNAITQSADLRKSIFDNPWTTSRLEITRAIVNVIESTPDIAKEKNWREFIKAVNRAGGGKVFEVMLPEDIRSTLDACAQTALCG